MRHVCVIAYVPRIYSCMYADCVIRRLYAICTRIKIIYMCNNYAHVQPLCTCATIMYAYKNYVCVQQLCMRTTIMYSYNNVCVLRVKGSTLDHVRAQTYPRAYTSYRLAKCIAPPWKKLKWRPWFGSYGGRVTLPTPAEQHRGKPLENPSTPRPPQDHVAFI